MTAAIVLSPRASTPLAAQQPSLAPQQSHRLPPALPPPERLPPPVLQVDPQAPSPPEELARAEIRLSDLEQIALQNHPQLLATVNAVAAAEGKAIQARLYPNPQVGVAAPQIAGRESQYNAFASQEILTGGKLQLDSAAAWQEVEQSRLTMTRVRYDVLTGVRRRFYAVLAAQNRVAVLEDLVSLATKSQKIGQMLFNAGEGTKTDTLLLEIELHKDQVALENARTVYEAGKRQLAAAVGVPQLAVGVLYGDLATELPRFDLPELQQRVIAVNPQTAVAEAEARRARILLDRAYVEPRPTFNIMGGYQHQEQGVQDQAIAQVLMSVPLWNKNQGGIRAARGTVGRAEADVRRVQVELAGQAAEALGRYRAALNTVERYQAQILPKSRESVSLTQGLYQQGQIDFLRLLQAQRTLGEVNLGYIDAQESRWNAAADIANLLQVERFP
ncbi:MAG TPA: TolC family protein [Pirellulaceae bacterium]|nr:TolC family protein [Pirellulaceae bacterium]